MTLGNIIASYRKKMGLTQESLAQQLDVTIRLYPNESLILAAPM